MSDVFFALDILLAPINNSDVTYTFHQQCKKLHYGYNSMSILHTLNILLLPIQTSYNLLALISSPFLLFL